MREALDRLGAGRPYRLMTAAVAGAAFHAPSLERPFVAATRAMWSAPAIGRFFRSSAYRLVDRLRTGADRFRDVTIEGVRLRVDVTEWMFSGTYFAGLPYEPQTSAYIAGHLRPGATFVDIGANSGYFTLLAAGLVGGGGRVLAFEPNPDVLQVLAQHVAVNGLADRVTLSDVALADIPDASASLRVSRLHSGFSSLVGACAPGPEYLAGARVLEVPSTTFDRWLAGSGIDHVDLVKIDVEGAEERVVRGMASALRDRRVERVICEAPPDGPACRFLVSCGYEPRLIEGVGPVANLAFVRPGVAA